MNSYETMSTRMKRNNTVKDNVTDSLNSNSNHESDINDCPNLKITPQALKYAVMHQLPPVKILCQPEVKNQLEGTKLIKELFSQIKSGFLKQNKTYNRSIGFDTWYINKGELISYTKEIKLFVYLWNKSHYPLKLLDTVITPIPSIHLPSQLSIILKHVPKIIETEDVQEALSELCYSKFYLEETQSSMTNRSRNIRTDIISKTEANKILNNDVFPLGGYLREVAEFLTSPQILICCRCNSPGHIKRECKEIIDK